MATNTLSTPPLVHHHLRYAVKYWLRGERARWDVYAGRGNVRMGQLNFQGENATTQGVRRQSTCSKRDSTQNNVSWVLNDTGMFKAAAGVVLVVVGAF